MNIIDKAKNLITLSEAVQPDWREVENPVGGQHQIIAHLEDGFLTVIAAFPPHNPATLANRAYAVAARNHGPEIAAALLVAVAALRLVRNELGELQQHAINLIDNTLRELGIEANDD